MNDLVNDFNGETEDGWSAVLSKADYARYRHATFGAGSKSLISKYIAEGKIAPPALRSDGRIDRALADAQLAQTVGSARRRAAAAGLRSRVAEPMPSDSDPAATPPADGTLVAEQIALTRARRRRMELETEKEEGKLIYADEARRTYFDAARRVRDRILAVPASVAASLVGKDEREIRIALRDAFNAALKEVADELKSDTSPLPDPDDAGD